jgi:energy-coupling factor transporter ATP-binding protein EcfA2
MIAALHLLSLKVSGWKAIPHDNPVEIDFRKEVNIGHSCLVTGPNESGKSSMFSALRFALFEIHNRGGEAPSDWVNHQSIYAKEGAEITVELLINGTMYTIEKNRKQPSPGSVKGIKGSSKLFGGCGEGKSLIAQGVPADEEILNLIGASKSTKRTIAESPLSWGLLAWLLAPQGMDSIDPARKAGTDALGLERSLDPDSSKLLETLNATLIHDLTEVHREPTGKFQEMINEKDTTLKNLKNLETKSEQFVLWLEKVRRLEIKLAEAENHKDTTVEEWELFLQSGGSQGSHEDKLELERLSNGAKVALEAHQSALKALDNLKALELKLKNANKIVKDQLGKEAVAEEKKNSARDRQREIDGLVDNTLNPLKAKRKELADIRARLKIAIANQNLSIASENLNQISNIEENIKLILDKGPILSIEDLDLMDSIAHELKLSEAILKSRKENSKWFVEKQGGFEGTIYVDGVEINDSTTLTPIASEMNVQTNGETQLTVRSIEDSDSVVPYLSRVDLLEKLSQFGVDSIEALDSKKGEEKPRATTHINLLKQLGDLPNKEEIDLQIDKLSKIIDENVVTHSVQDLELQVKLLDDEIENLSESYDDLLVNQKENSEKLGKLRERLREIESKRRDADIESKIHSDNRDEMLKEGTLSSLKKNLTEKRKQYEHAEKVLDEFNEQSEQIIQTRKNESTRLAKNKNKSSLDVRNLDLELEIIKKNLEDYSSEDFNAKLQELTLKFQRERKNLLHYERAIRAKDRLAIRIRQKLTEATSADIEPIRKKVQMWLNAVTQGKWTEVDLNEQLEVMEIRGPLNTHLPGESSGSGGLQEVIHALIRLAVATHIHDLASKDNDNFPPVTIVMDESQGHVDKGRVSLLMNRFNQAIDKGKIQVIALSHRGDEFRSLNPVIEYDMEQRKIIEILDEQ